MIKQWVIPSPRKNSPKKQMIGFFIHLKTKILPDLTDKEIEMDI
jgi:hypothetical protein